MIAGQTAGAGCRVGSSKIVLNFYCMCSKNAESNTELKGLDVDSLVIEHILVNRAPKVLCRTCRAHVVGSAPA